MPRLIAILAAALLAAVGTTASFASASAADKPEDPGAQGKTNAQEKKSEAEEKKAEAKGDPQPDKGKEPDNAHGENLPKAKAPESGKSVKVEPARGRVKVKLPGSREFVVLEDGASLPVGSLVDASRGALKLSSEDDGGHTDSATFSGAAFTVHQKTGGEFTTLVLRSRPLCGGRARRSAVGRSASPLAGISRKRRRAGRKLWGSGKGRFRTRGRYGAATVRGTVWMTQNRCNGTLVKVKRGIVDVRDFAKKKTVAVEAGERYLAKRAKR